jgi:D-inositol-3-phosphate glycosyltransferase
MKRILIVTHHYPPHITGVGMVAQNHAKRLAALGHNVTVITSRTNSNEKSSFVDNVNVIRVAALNFSEKWSAPFPIFSPSLLPALWKATKQADIVHIHDAFYMSSFFAALFAHWQKKPIALTQHVAMIAHPNKLVIAIQKIVYATTGKMIFKYSSVIFTLNDRVEKFLIGHEVPKEKLIELPNGVDTELFYPVSKKEKSALRKQFNLAIDKKILLFVGRFVPKKGFDKLLAARSDRYQIVFAGSEAPENVTGGDVIFLGRLMPEKLAQLYQAADIFILPSQDEGFPLSVQEAMASGLPVITTNDHGYNRYNLDKKMVYLLDNPTEASIREAIEKILDNDDRLKDMATYSEHYAKTNFSWPLIVSKLESAYDGILLEISQS